MFEFKAYSQSNRGGMLQPTCLPLPMTVVAGAGLEVEPAGEAATASALETATTLVEVAITSSNSIIIDYRCNQGSSSAHSIFNNIRPHRSSSSGEICISIIMILGTAEFNHLIDSAVPEWNITTAATTTLRRRQVVMVPAAYVLSLQRGGELLHRVQGKYDSSPEHA